MVGWVTSDTLAEKDSCMYTLPSYIHTFMYCTFGIRISVQHIINLIRVYCIQIIQIKCSTEKVSKLKYNFPLLMVLFYCSPPRNMSGTMYV